MYSFISKKRLVIFSICISIKSVAYAEKDCMQQSDLGLGVSLVAAAFGTGFLIAGSNDPSSEKGKSYLQAGGILWASTVIIPGGEYLIRKNIVCEANTPKISPVIAIGKLDQKIGLNLSF